MYGKRADDDDEERCNERRIRNVGGGGVSEWLNWLYWLLARAKAVPVRRDNSSISKPLQVKLSITLTNYRLRNYQPFATMLVTETAETAHLGDANIVARRRQRSYSTTALTATSIYEEH